MLLKFSIISRCIFPKQCVQAFTFDHRTLRTRLPVRSALFKQRTGGLVVRWVTTGESPLLNVFFEYLFAVESVCYHRCAYLSWVILGSNNTLWTPTARVSRCFYETPFTIFLLVEQEKLAYERISCTDTTNFLQNEDESVNFGQDIFVLLPCVIDSLCIP
jgi:hypothetical protein